MIFLHVLIYFVYAHCDYVKHFKSTLWINDEHKSTSWLTTMSVLVLSYHLRWKQQKKFHFSWNEIKSDKCMHDDEYDNVTMNITVEVLIRMNNNERICTYLLMMAWMLIVRGKFRFYEISLPKIVDFHIHLWI
jgi:hypothetical protein